MASKGLLTQLKSIIADMTDSNGNIKALPGGQVGKLDLPINKLKFIENLIILLRDTKLITQETKMYLFDKYITIKGVNEAVNEAMSTKETPDSSKIPLSSTASRITYDKTKLTKIFGQHLVVNMLSRSSSIEVYEQALAEQFRKYNSIDLRDSLIISIPKDCMQMELSEDKFQDFLEVILPYIKSQVKFVEDNLDIEACGYFNYLLSYPNLEGTDKDRADRLKILLGKSSDKE